LNNQGQLHIALTINILITVDLSCTISCKENYCIGIPSPFTPKCDHENGYLAESDEKNSGVLSFEAMNKVLPGGTHFAILQIINSGRVSLSR